MIGKTNICHLAFVSLRKTLEIFLLHLLDVTSTAKICFILDTPPLDNFQFQMYYLFLVYFYYVKLNFALFLFLKKPLSKFSLFFNSEIQAALFRRWRVLCRHSIITPFKWPSAYLRVFFFLIYLKSAAALANNFLKIRKLSLWWRLNFNPT